MSLLPGDALFASIRTYACFCVCMRTYICMHVSVQVLLCAYLRNAGYGVALGHTPAKGARVLQSGDVKAPETDGNEA